MSSLMCINSMQPIQSRNTVAKDPNARPVKNKNGIVVSAIIVDRPPASFITRLRNLLDFALECLDQLPSHAGNDDAICDRYSQCVKYLASLSEAGDAKISENLSIMLNKFMAEAQEIDRYLADARATQSAQDPNASFIVPAVEIYLAAKTSSLRWRSLALIEELKRMSDNSTSAGKR